MDSQETGMRQQEPPHRSDSDRAIDRRTVLRAAVAASVAGPMVGARTLATLAQDRKSKPLFRISLAQWSLHRELFSGRMDNLDFARIAKSEFQIDTIEYVNQFFADKAEDLDYLGEMRNRARERGVRATLIRVDGEGALGDPSDSKRREAVERHYKWVDAARRLGCISIRVNAQSAGSYDEQMNRAADGLRQLTAYAAKRNTFVLVENDGGLSSNGAWLAGVMEKVGHRRCGTLPDFGNFHLGGGEWYDRYQGVAELMPYARAVSAKSYAFDEDGNETTIDYRRMLKMVVDAGYTGHIGIEYEGRDLSEAEGIRKTKALLARVHDELAAAAKGG